MSTSPSVFGRTLEAWRRETRAELGLPTDRAIIMTGHQAGIWHAGIAEKFRVGAELARTQQGVLVHVVVDHDLNDASLVHFPALIEQTVGTPTLLRLALERTPRPRASVPNTLRQPVRTMRPERRHEVPAEIEPALHAIEVAIEAERHRANLALQMAHAANALLAPSVRVDGTIAATEIASTTFAKALRNAFETAGVREHYNASIEGQRIAPLAPHELPFWKLDRATSTREPLYSNAAYELVAPRALALTAIARLVLCDTFIHGTGGARYDEAMEHWIGSAFGAELCAALAPRIVATATRHAPLSGFAAPFDDSATPLALRTLEQDPFADAGKTKRALLATITGTRAEKRVAFVAMHDAMRRAREERAEEFASLRARIGQNSAARRTHALITDRTWPFPLTMISPSSA